MLHGTIKVEELHRVIVYKSDFNGKFTGLQVQMEFYYDHLKVSHWDINESS